MQATGCRGAVLSDYPRDIREDDEIAEDFAEQRAGLAKHVAGDVRVAALSARGAGDELRVGSAMRARHAAPFACGAPWTAKSSSAIGITMRDTDSCRYGQLVAM